MKVKAQLSRRGGNWGIESKVEESAWPADEEQPKRGAKGWTLMNTGYKGK
jgi:hypothetical protein